MSNTHKETDAERVVRQEEARLYREEDKREEDREDAREAKAAEAAALKAPVKHKKASAPEDVPVEPPVEPPVAKEHAPIVSPADMLLLRSIADGAEMKTPEERAGAHRLLVMGYVTAVPATDPPHYVVSPGGKSAMEQEKK